MGEDGTREVNWKDYYAILGVEPDADSEAVARAHVEVLRRLRTSPSEPESAQHRLRLVDEAYQCLSDPVRRATYNKVYWTRRRKGPKAFLKSSLSQVLLVCPDCDAQSLYDFRRSTEKVRCPHCHAVFTTQAGKLKALSVTRTGLRWYYVASMVGLYDGKEKQVEFDAEFKIEESDIRPGDNLVLSYLGIEFAVIQNLTTNHYWRLVSPSTAH